jgi:hypothetical protein
MSYLALILSALSYAIGIVAQTVAARRATMRDGLDVGLLARLASDRIYLLGFAAQVAGFVLAFLARATLPLYLVQAASSSAVGIAAAIGAVLLGWRVRVAELSALIVMVFGLLALVGAAQSSVADPLPLGIGFALLAVVVGSLVAAIPVSRMQGPRSGVLLGMLAGVDFAVLAIVSRPLAAGPLTELPLNPLTWIVIGAAVVGQGLLAAALQRGSSTAAMASMDATSVVLAAVVGLTVLGDHMVAGGLVWVLVGLSLVVGGVLAMALVQPGTQAREPAKAPIEEVVTQE